MQSAIRAYGWHTERKKPCQLEKGSTVASIWRDARSGNFLIKFHFAGKRYTRSCETPKEKDANGIKAAVEETVGFLNTGRLTMPEGVTDPGVWIMSGGKLNQKPKTETARLRLVGEICDAYYQDQLDKADTTLKGEINHINHLKRQLGEKTVLDSLTLETMQSYVNDRSKADNRFGGKVSGSTVKKELTTFKQIWDWARQRGFVKRPCPIKDAHRPRKWAVKIRKPEDGEKFMTWGEIERRIARCGLSRQQQNELWNSSTSMKPKFTSYWSTFRRMQHIHSSFRCSCSPPTPEPDAVKSADP